MKRLNLALVAACVSFAYVASAEELRLKTRIIDPTLDNVNPQLFRSSANQPRSMAGKRWHWLIQFDSDAPDFSEWIRRGATVLSSVPVNGFVISAPGEMSWQDLFFTYRAPIDAVDKLSPRIAAANLLTGDATSAPNAAQVSLVIIHFHKDVEAWEADGILDAESVSAIRNGSLQSADRLAELTQDQIAALRLWDEVEFIFPAPNEMKEGELYMVCGGVLSAGYEVAMLAASCREGWDGPGRGRVGIGYSFGNIGTRTDPAQTRAEVRRALDQWSRASSVAFTESSARTATRNIDIFFATGAHADPFPFLSGTTVLAHSFYPAPPNPEPIAGDIHINDAWSWSIGGQWDIYSVVLHEIGHSLGIGHTDTPGSVMFPYYQKAEGLKAQDIDSIRQLYADPSSPTTPTPTPFSFTIVNPAEGTRLRATTLNLNGTIQGANNSLRMKYINETNAARNSCLANSTATTFSCAAIPLAGGQNSIALTATLNGSSITLRRIVILESNGDVALTITSPATSGHSTTAQEIRVAGTASHPGGIAGVTWATNRNRNGAATGLEAWSANIPLEFGTNEISVTAGSRSGISSTRKITVERSAAIPITPPANPAEDKVPPRMTIQQPIGNFIITSASKLTFRGAATDNVSVKQVTWTNSAGDQSGAAAAITAAAGVNWSFDVNIAVGFNAIQVRAWDVSGNSTLYSTTVRRY